MNELLQTLLTTWHSAWRFRWTAVIVAWLVAILGWALVWAIPASYESQARVYVDRDTVLKPLLQGLAVGTDVTNDVRLIATVLLSRPNLERVARETDLHLRARGAKEFDELVNRLSNDIQLTSEGSGGTYTITYADTDAKMAQRVVQTLLNTFVEDSLGIKREDSSSAQQFLLEQIKEYEQRLRTAEDRLAEFKRNNVGMMPGQQGDYYTRLQAHLGQLDELRAKQRQISERRTELARQLTGEEPTFGIVASGAAGPVGPYETKIAELKTKLEALRVDFTDKHPEVIAIQETIARLEAEKEANGPPPSLFASPDAGKRTLAALDLNPVYQNMKIALSQADADLAELRGQIAAVESQVAMLRSRVTTIPQVEAELAQLNRDYEVNRAQHTQLLQRLESARISQEADRSTDGVKFRIIDPPALPLLPASPNRPVLLSACFVLGIVAAVGGAYLLAQLRPAFGSRADFEKQTGIRVLGTISKVQPARSGNWLRREPTLLSGSAALLLIAFVVNLVAAI